MLTSTKNYEWQNRWRFARQALNGTGIFYTGDVLDKFGRESDEDYQSRKDQYKYTYENIFSQKVDKFIAHIFKQGVKRETTNSLLSIMLDDIDGNGTHLNDFMVKFAKHAKALGVGLLLVDMHQVTAQSLDEQINRRQVPYFVEILPENVYDYELDDNKTLKYVKYIETIDGEYYFREWDTQGWKLQTKDGNLVSEGQHNLGVCPILVFSEMGAFESVGSFTSIAGLSKKLVNIESELRNIMRYQGFSILTIQTSRGVEPDFDVGASNLLTYTGENPPAYINSDSSQASIYEERMLKIREAIDIISFDTVTTKSQETAQSLQIRFEGLNAALNAFAQKLDRLETQAFELVCRYLGLSSDNLINISYPTNFQISDPLVELQMLENIRSIARIPTYEIEKLKKIIKQDLNSLDDDIINKIYEEIAVGLKMEFEN